MTPEDEFRARPGRIRSRGAGQGKSFVGRVLAAANQAGRPSAGVRRRGSVFGRGRPASLNALRRVGGRSRLVIVKARVVRHRASSAPLAVHVRYLERDGVTQNGAPGRLFDARGDEVDGGRFAERCAEDRHHFRFIVAPEDAAELADLKAFTRDLMAGAEADLGTRLDWVAVDHWNTAHPHVHVLVRGVAEDGRDLVISRDYISDGLRARASQLVTLELGQRTDREIRHSLQAEIEAERWTRLDRTLTRDAADHGGVIDLRAPLLKRGDPLRTMKLGRLAKLERLGLAERAGTGRWRLSPQVEPTLRELARRGDVIGRLHRALSDQGVDRAAESWRLDGEATPPALGRLMARGLDDELAGSAYAVIDGTDGRIHHIRLPSLDAAGDAPIGAIVESRRLDDKGGLPVALVLAVRSDLSLSQQVTASGATWLDHQLVGRAPADLGESGFGQEVREALAKRADHLASQGLARRQAGRVTFARDLLETLRRRELDGAAAKLSAETGLAHRPLTEGEHVTGVVRLRLTLASGRIAMIDDGLGFSLVPWRADLERRLGQQVTGVVTPSGVDWGLGRQRGPGR